MTKASDREPNARLKPVLIIVVGLAVGAVVGGTWLLQHFAGDAEHEDIRGDPAPEAGATLAKGNPFTESIYEPHRRGNWLPRPTTRTAESRPDEKPLVEAGSGDPDYEALIGDWVLDRDGTAKLINKDVAEEAAADPDSIAELLATTISSLEASRCEVSLRRDGTYTLIRYGFETRVDERTSGTFVIKGRFAHLTATHRNGKALDEKEESHLTRAGDRLMVMLEGETQAVLQKTP